MQNLAAQQTAPQPVRAPQAVPPVTQQVPRPTASVANIGTAGASDQEKVIFCLEFYFF